MGPYTFSRKSDRAFDIDKRSFLKLNLSSTTVKSNQFCSLWKFCFFQWCSIWSQHRLLVSLSTSLGGKPMLAGEPLTSAQFYRTIDDGHPECGEWTQALLQVGPLWAIIPSALHSPWSIYNWRQARLLRNGHRQGRVTHWHAGWVSVTHPRVGMGGCHSKLFWMFPKQISSGRLVPVLMILGLNIFTGFLPPLGKHTDRDQLLPLGSFDFPFSCGHWSLLTWLLHSNFWVISCISVAKSRDFIKKSVYACMHRVHACAQGCEGLFPRFFLCSQYICARVHIHLEVARCL